MSFNTSRSKPCSSLWNKMQWHPTSKQLKTFIALQALLEDWNKRVNLTRLIDGNDYWIAQILDSLWPLDKDLSDTQTQVNCVDVGSGCGFPGLALAIALPNSKLTLIEAVSRKALILKNIAKELGIQKRVTVLNERAELTGQNPNFRGQFDFAMARAVASAPIVCEYLIPLLKQKGQALIYQGKWSELNQYNHNKALILLNAKISSVQKLHLPNGYGERHLIRVIATENCPQKYPRRIGIPSKKPLGN